MRSGGPGFTGFSVLRALRRRAGVAILILLLAVISVASATVGPLYEHAARDSIVDDVFSSAPTIEKGLELSQDGPVAGAADGIREQAVADLAGRGGSESVAGVFQAPVESTEVATNFETGQVAAPLVYRTAVCAHLRITSGQCPTQAKDVVVSTSFAAITHLGVGDIVPIAGWHHIRISGVYVAPSATQEYWFGRGTVYFPTEEDGASATVANSDAMFTPASTIAGKRGVVEGTAVVDLFLQVDRIHAAQLQPLLDGVNRIVNDQVFFGQEVNVATGIPSASGTIRASWSTLGVPVVVATAELVLLAWMLLFVVVSDAIEARGTEIALVKLRGFGQARTLGFAVAEPAVLLAIALPVGVLLGWLSTRRLGQVLLRSGTSVPLTTAGWIGGALAAVGGLAAVVVAARRTLVRPVVDQWQRTGSTSPRRGWVLDAVIITAAVAGLIQMTATGVIGSSKHGGVVLIAPALIGLAIAVPAARLLPLAARAAFGVTARRRGLAGFLAVRTVARRPGGTRTTMILATAFALVSFAIASWSVGQHNREQVSGVTTGAADVLSVRPSPHESLETSVDRADPSGHKAVAVLSYSNGPLTLLATQPARFAAVAHWVGGSLSRPLNTLPQLLEPPEPSPVALNGTAIRISLNVVKMTPSAARLIADVAVPGAGSPTPVELGVVRNRQDTTLTARLPGGCGCTLVDLALQVQERLGIQPPQLLGAATLGGVQVRGANGWQTVPDLNDPKHWSATYGPAGPGGVTEASGTLHWSFSAQSNGAAAIRIVDRPTPLPAVVATPVLNGGPGTAGTLGLDGTRVRVRTVATSDALPGEPGRGVLVDLTYARRAAGNAGISALSTVWVAPGARAAITKALAAQGVTVTGVQTQSTVTATLNRQGPGLASVLLLAEAGAAAALAAVGAVLTLTITARRRRYEYVALAVEGVSRRTLRAAIMLEQLIVLGYGALVGIGAGVVAMALSLSSVPEFVHLPLAPSLSYTPRWATLAVALAAALAVLAAAAIASGLLLVRSLDPEQLREGAA